MKFKFVQTSWYWILSEKNNILTRRPWSHHFLCDETCELNGSNNCEANSPSLIPWEKRSSRFTLQVQKVSMRPIPFLWSTKKIYLVKCKMKPIMNTSLPLDSWKCGHKRLKALQWTQRVGKKYKFCDFYAFPTRCYFYVTPYFNFL